MRILRIGLDGLVGVLQAGVEVFYDFVFVLLSLGLVLANGDGFFQIGLGGEDKLLGRLGSLGRGGIGWDGLGLLGLWEGAKEGAGGVSFTEKSESYGGGEDEKDGENDSQVFGYGKSFEGKWWLRLGFDDVHV